MMAFSVIHFLGDYFTFSSGAYLFFWQYGCFVVHAEHVVTAKEVWVHQHLIFSKNAMQKENSGKKNSIKRKKIWVNSARWRTRRGAPFFVVQYRHALIVQWIRTVPSAGAKLCGAEFCHGSIWIEPRVHEEHLDALIVQWIERFRPKEKILVRFRVRAQTRSESGTYVSLLAFVSRSDILSILKGKIARPGRWESLGNFRKALSSFCEKFTASVRRFLTNIVSLETWHQCPPHSRQEFPGSRKTPAPLAPGFFNSPMKLSTHPCLLSMRKSY